MHGDLVLVLSREKMLEAGYLVQKGDDVETPPAKGTHPKAPFKFSLRPNSTGQIVSVERNLRCYLPTFTLGEEVRPFIEAMSYFGPLPNNPTRAYGRYLVGTTVGYLDRHDDTAARDVAYLRVPSITSFEELLELYTGIREGTLLPVPGSNWSLPQLGKPSEAA